MLLCGIKIKQHFLIMGEVFHICSKEEFIMGYTFYICSKEKSITKDDFDTAISNLSNHNRDKSTNSLICDVELENPYCIRVSGVYGISGKYAEGFVLNLVINLINLGYIPKVLSKDWEYGTAEDWEWFEDLNVRSLPF